MSGKMEVLTLLLMFLTVSGYSYVLQPRMTVTQMADLDRDPLSEMKGGPLRDVEEKESSERRRKTEAGQRSGAVTQETNLEKTMEAKIPTDFARNTGENFHISNIEGHEKGIKERTTSETFSETFSEADLVKDSKDILTDNTKTLNSHNKLKQEMGKDEPKSNQMDKMQQELEEEEKESKLVAGISLHKETRGEEILTINQEHVEDESRSEERGKREENVNNANYDELLEGEKKDHVVVNNLTPPLSTSSSQMVKEFDDPATIQMITQSQNPHNNINPSLLFTPTHVPPASSHPPTLLAKVSPHFFPPAVTHPNPTTINVSVSTGAPGKERSTSLLEDLLTEVFHSPGHHLKQNELETKASPILEDMTVKNILFKPAQKELHATREINTAVQPKEVEFISKVQAATPKPTEAKFTTKDLNTKETNSTPKSNENNPVAKLGDLTRKPNIIQPTGKPKTVRQMGNDTKLTVKKNEASPSQPQLTKPSAKTQLTSSKNPSARPTKINRSSKSKTMKKSKEKKKKKDNKSQKPSEKKKEVAPTHFPYFLDNYCPPECACYGRVVQCSDKGVDKVPYGIPYNARYILLMNNRINMIQLDLLNEYVSMEFLVLSNNQLTDGAIEGAFEGIPALKRLYLDKNLLESVPTDLPASLEELRLDNNQLSVMSEAAWARCPGLLVLSLSNNSLGNGSHSLPNAVLSPLSNLRTLNLDHNQLTSFPLGLPLSIKELYLKGNLIEEFLGGAFDQKSELMVLDLSANRLTNKGLLRESLLNATHLESLNLEGNRLKQVPRHLPHSLKTLNLEGNLISSIKKVALSVLKNLEHLGLARNKIFKVAPGAFRALPVLHQLDLCHNTLRQVPRQLPHALHSVAITHNKIQSVPRDAFCWGNRSMSLSGLVRVQLEHNLIDMGKLDSQAFRCLRGFQVVHFY